MTPRYEPHEIEAKWQRVWEDERAFHVPNPVEGEPTAENHWYQLEMLPYPSGPSLHMGHVLNYTMGDVQTHVRRRSGWHVVRPMGWDAFGLPAENAAIREGKHPRETIERNIETMRAQMKRLGWAIDWDREVSAHQPTFYRWTQWLFQQFVKHDLCYRREGPVNWCPNDQTVIANEYVVDGHCERCGAEVELRNMTQWYMRTTAYADELLEYPDAQWPARTMAIQRNWIGRSEGAEILFKVDETGDDLDGPARVHELVGRPGGLAHDDRGHVAIPVDKDVEELVEAEQNRRHGEPDPQQPERLVGRIGAHRRGRASGGGRSGSEGAGHRACLHL